MAFLFGQSATVNHRKGHDPALTTKPGHVHAVTYPVKLKLTACPPGAASQFYKNKHTMHQALSVWDVVQSFRSFQLADLGIEHLLAAFRRRQCHHPEKCDLLVEWQQPVIKEIYDAKLVMKGNYTLRLSKYWVIVKSALTRLMSHTFRLLENDKIGAACITGCFGFPEFNHILTDATMELAIAFFDKGPGKKPVGWRLDQLNPAILNDAAKQSAVARQRRLDGLPEVIRSGISAADYAAYQAGTKVFSVKDLWDTDFDDVVHDAGKPFFHNGGSRPQSDFFWIRGQ